MQVISDHGTLDLCRILVPGPAVLSSSLVVTAMVTKEDEWRVRFAQTTVEQNREWSRCLALLAHACDVGYLVDRFPDGDVAINGEEIKKSRVLHWLGTIRDLSYAHSMNKIPNPKIMHRTKISGSGGPEDDGVIFPGCRIKIGTFRRGTARFLEKLMVANSKGGVFPYLNHQDVCEAALLSYQLCILYCNEPGINTARELFFACCCEACCPFFFPSVPTKSPDLMRQLSDDMLRNIRVKLDFQRLAFEFGARDRFVVPTADQIFESVSVEASLSDPLEPFQDEAVQDEAVRDEAVRDEPVQDEPVQAKPPIGDDPHLAEGELSDAPSDELLDVPLLDDFLDQIHAKESPVDF
jgi:hypothetical protein